MRGPQQPGSPQSIPSLGRRTGLSSATPGPGKPGPLVAGAAYAVGYAKPPEQTRFPKGVSGNPRGRPKGAKNKMPALHEERMKAIILQEAYRDIKVRDGERTVTVPIAQAVLRSVAVNAVKGQHRSQRLFAELVSAVETSHKALHDDWLLTAMQYKVDWEIELHRRARLGIIGAPEPLPHPDHVLIDLQAGTARVIGPSTNEEKVAWDKHMARKAEFQARIAELKEKLDTETDPKRRRRIEKDIAVTRMIVDVFERAERGEL